MPTISTDYFGSTYLHVANAGKINIRKWWRIISTALKLQRICAGGCRKHANRDGHGEYRMEFVQNFREISEELRSDTVRLISCFATAKISD